MNSRIRFENKNNVENSWVSNTSELIIFLGKKHLSPAAKNVFKHVNRHKSLVFFLFCWYWFGLFNMLLFGFFVSSIYGPSEVVYHVTRFTQTLLAEVIDIQEKIKESNDCK